MHWEAVKDEKKKEKSKGSRETFKEGKKNHRRRSEGAETYRIKTHLQWMFTGIKRDTSGRFRAAVWICHVRVSSVKNSSLCL